jgi:hypothetical protein
VAKSFIAQTVRKDNPMKEEKIKLILTYIKNHGRPLEKARLNYLLGEGDETPILEELIKYQNLDGGFGHGLEPDYINPNSSPIQTWTATTILREIAFNKKDPMILSMMDYLEKSFNQKSKRWAGVIPSNNDYPHAPWWHYRDEEPSFNPSASLAGFILHYANPMHPVFKYATLVAQEALTYLLSHDAFEVHELRCLIDLILDAEAVYKHYQPFKDAKAKLIHLVEKTIEKDHLRWFKDYVPKPTSLIHTHPNYLSEAYLDLLYLEFEEALKHTNFEGVWEITWTWQSYPEAFSHAKKDWKSVMAFGYLYLMIQTDFISNLIP